MKAATAARKIALYDAPGYLDVQRAHAALRLLETIDGGDLPGMDNDTAEWFRSIAKGAIAESLAAAEKKITKGVTAMLAAERAAAAQGQMSTPAQPEKVTNLMDGLKRSIARKAQGGCVMATRSAGRKAR